MSPSPAHFVTLLAVLGVAAAACTTAAPAPTVRPAPVVEAAASALEEPLLVVEAGHAWWPPAANASDTALDPTAAANARALFGDEALVFVGDGAVRDVTLASPTWKEGECGAGQTAFPFSDAKGPRRGVLLRRRALAADATPLVEAAVPGLTDCYQGLPPPPAGRSYDDDGEDGPVRECAVHGSADGARAVQVRAAGTAEAGSPHWHLVQWRLLRQSPGGWDAGGWQPTSAEVPGQLPLPHAVLSETPLQIVWTLHEGICCPSASTAWVTSTDAGGTTTFGPTRAGGVGQPCD